MPSQHPNSFQASQRELLGRLRGAQTTGRPAIEPPRLKRGNYCPARFSVSTKQPQLCFVVCYMHPFLTAGVAESVDAPDSKSGEGNLVWVRVPPPAQHKSAAHPTVSLVCTRRSILTEGRFGDSFGDNRRHFGLEENRIHSLEDLEAEFDLGSTETRTVLNRRRLNVENRRQRWNAPIQGTACDAFKQAAVELHERSEEVGGFRIVALIHDEVVLLAPEGRAAKAEEWARNVMSESAASVVNAKLPKRLHIPIEVDSGAGKTLQEAKDAA